MKRIFYIAISLVTLMFFSCEKDTSNFTDIIPEIQIDQVKTISKKNHKWYYFTYDGFEQTNLPQFAPRVIFKPWTEAIRISSSLSIGTDGFLTVNKLGLLVCNPENEKQAELSTDNQFFADLTVDNMTSVDGMPVFHLYKNPEFNTSEKADTNHPFLVQFHPESSVFMPLLYTEDLDFSDDVEVSDIVYNDSEWAVTLKSMDDSKKDFEYLRLSSYDSLSNIEAKERKNLLVTEEISESAYRSKVMPENISSAPDRVKSLLARLPDNFEYYIQCSQPNMGVKTEYIQAGHSLKEDGTIMESQVLLNDTFSIAVFTDGTGFFQGAIDGKYVINNGNPVAFRLPKLPMGFTYGTIIVEKNILYVAWEETQFYEVGRTGFLTVDLDKVFYPKG